MIKITTFAIAIAALATAAPAAEVPLTIHATGYTELLIPQSISYVAEQAAVSDDPASASALALQLLAVDAECKREIGNKWWDTAVYHEELAQ